VNANPSSGTLSQSGLDAIKRSEGFSATPYWDSKGYSIGYGHLLTPEEYAKYKDRSITKEEAEQLLLKDTEKTQNAVNQSIKVPLTQDMFDALVSFGYNLGPGAIKNVAQTLNTGDYEGAAKRMRRYVIANGKVNTGLIARRKEETGKFLASMKPQQGQTILNMQKQNEDGRAEMQSKGQQGRGNTVVSAPKTNISSTSVIAPQQDPRNNDSTYRTAQNKNYR
jgi:GH24 family phage-related lysozyme (muramidase)